MIYLDSWKLTYMALEHFGNYFKFSSLLDVDRELIHDDI